MTERIDPDCNITEAEALRLLGVMARGVGSVNYNGNGKGGWRDWMLGLTMLLAAAGTTGAVVMYGNQSSQQTAIVDLKEQIRDLRGDVKELTNTLRSRP